jgi:hypothetical protein
MPFFFCLFFSFIKEMPLRAEERIPGSFDLMFIFSSLSFRSGSPICYLVFSFQLLGKKRFQVGSSKTQSNA